MVHAPVIFGGGEEIDEIVQAHKNLSVSERGDLKTDRRRESKAGQKKKTRTTNHLGSDQEIRKDGIFEDAFFHSANMPQCTGWKGMKVRRGGSRTAPTAVCNNPQRLFIKGSKLFQASDCLSSPRRPVPAWGSSSPRRHSPSLPSMVSRMATKFPRRIPWLLGVVLPLVI